MSDRLGAFWEGLAALEEGLADERARIARQGIRLVRDEPRSVPELAVVQPSRIPAGWRSVAALQELLAAAGSSPLRLVDDNEAA